MKYLSILVLVLISISCNTNIVEISEWRGVDRSGKYLVDNLLPEWGENGPELVASIYSLGNGYGSPTFAEDNYWIVGTKDSLSYLMNFNVFGELLGEYEIGKEWIVNFPGSRCAPTIVDEKVYAMTGQGNVVCFDRNTKSMDWSMNMVSDYGGVIPRFGFSQSLVVEGDKLFCCPGGPDNNVLALNRFTGDVIWTHKGVGERPAYNPAKVIEVNSRKIFTTFSAYHFMGFDIETGDMLWKHEQKNIAIENRKPGMGDTHANTILFENNIIYYIEGDGNCAVALKVSDDGNSITQLWNNATVDNYMGGFVKFDRYIYSCSYSKKTIVKIDVENGNVVDSIEVGRGSLIAANEMLIYYTERGEVHLINIENDQLVDVSSFKIEEGSNQYFAHPVIHDGLLYIRHGEFMGSYKISHD